MKQIKNQFILMDIAQFSAWLNAQKVSRAIHRLQNHHTWKPDYSNFRGDNHFNLLDGMRRAHMKRGFSDIAQNITTFPDGTVAVCRSLERTPAGIKGANMGGICMEHIGNFDVGGDTMTAAHQQTIIALNALLCAKFKLKPDSNSIIYHHWWDLNTGKRSDGKGMTKSCPGTSFFGGNKVADAERNFIPLVKTRLKTVSGSL